MKCWVCLPLLAFLGCQACGTAEGAADASTARTGSQRSSQRGADTGGVDIVDTGPRSIATSSRGGVDAGVTGAAAPREGHDGIETSRAAASGAAAHTGHGGSTGGVGRPGDAGSASPGRSIGDQGSSMREPGHGMGGEAGPRNAQVIGFDEGADAGATRGAAQSAPDATVARTGLEEDAGTGPSRATNTGSCCSTSAEPGCGDSALQQCVCALQPSCCSEAWTQACTFVIAHKYCQPGVRECVCGSAEGQWKQADCCAQGWTDTCESVAIHKCGADPGCG